MESKEQAQQAALELSKGYAGVMDSGTYYGLGWTVSLNEGYNTLTATYETEDGELITWSVDPKKTGVLNNQDDLSALIEALLGSLGRYGDWTGWTELV